MAGSENKAIRCWKIDSGPLSIDNIRLKCSAMNYARFTFVPGSFSYNVRFFVVVSVLVRCKAIERLQ